MKTTGYVSRAFYALWERSLLPAGGALLALLVLTLRWLLSGGIRHFQVEAFLPWLAAGIGLLLWLGAPAAHYLVTTADERSRRLTTALRRAIQELAEWLALPLELAYLLGRWGALAALAALAVWLLLAGGDPDLSALRPAVPVAIRFALFLLLYLIIATIAAVVAGLWSLLAQRHTDIAPTADRSPGEPATSDQR